MDQLVLDVQTWLNQTYTGVDGWTPVTEDGITGWETVNALIEALQIEEGITSLSPNFGPTTTADFTPMQYTDGTTVSNKNYILQGGFWCKGIGPGAWNGIFDNNTQQTVMNFQIDAGLPPDGVVTAMLMKALLNMDAYVLIEGGDANIRTIQQSLNADYNSYFGLISCDGVYDRGTNTALIYALQAEEGLSPSVANGTFGPTTTADCPTLSSGSSGNFVKILQWALYCNGFDPSGFDGNFGPGTEAAVADFQSFMGMNNNGVADMPTIKALLSSAGDTNRSAVACDMATILTSTTAAELASAGYKYVGRYLTGTVGSGSSETSKAVTASELQAIFGAGLNAFIIYEDGGYQLSYFTAAQGKDDAQTALTAATSLNNGTQALPAGTTIYFAVDYDALDTDIQNNILPYFQALSAEFNANNYPGYVIGVYGTRNVCNQVWQAGYADRSFVADMSTGWSGNLGFTMPTNWTFDQFVGRTVGSDSLQIDADGFSGADIGINSLIETSTLGPTDSELIAARLAKIADLSNALWLLKDIPTVGFQFGQEYTFDMGAFFVTYEASAELKTPGSEYQSFTVTNGQIESEYTLSNEFSTLNIDSSGDGLVASLGTNVQNGTVYISIVQGEYVNELSVVLDSNDVPVGDTPFTTSLEQSFTFEWNYAMNSDTAPETTPAVSSNMNNVGRDVFICLLVVALVVAPEAAPLELLGALSSNVGAWAGLAAAAG